ncbi:hypothetical protein [Streptoalloteichus hindustanus]|uniref:Uncharacterized protein n=1 Tax=Streptoalloteichus hindustanus TaxID=2017 RepID=A0A1M5J179_STRHI|nr:hypothetical protein [Streptoalloteichus hindustanus]SHG34337.1 hypothetical protein SAMN05444320_10892 [Streptoalloteichus hindustanus]
MTAESISHTGDQAAAAVVAAPQLDDEATRHLSAAAHLDETFADNAIEEFLAEPRRAVPPSPGVDAAVVLREALAARRRRLLRDVAVLVAFLVALLIAPVTAVAWVAVAAIWLVIHATTTASARMRGVEPSTARTGLITAGVLAFLLFSTVLTLPTTTTSSSRRYGYRSPMDEALDALAPGVAVFLLLVLMFVVLLSDRLALRHLLINHFTYGRFRQPQPQDSRLDHALRASGWEPHAKRLGLISNAGQRGNLVVHDGWRAFVGSGTLARSWSVAVQLRQDEEAAETDAEPTPLNPTELYDRVAEELKRMRGSDNLAPGLRLRELSDSEHAVVSALSLMRYRHEELACHILPSPTSTPANWLPAEVLRNLADRSPEWIRYFRCFRVETWHKELVISSYLHIGCDERTLYVEWDAFQLNPVAPYYTRGEWAETRLSHAISRALIDLVALPGTVPRRVRTIYRVLRDAARRAGITYRQQHVVPSAYGARRSIRELAANRRGETYFHEMDGIRHVKLMERRAMAAIADCLAEHGYSTKEFTGSANAVIHNTVINDSQVSGLNIGGRGNTVNTGDTKMSRGRDEGGKD